MSVRARSAFLGLIIVGLFAIGCVERKLHIRSEPPGVIVQVNGREVGRTPLEWPYEHYGVLRVNARRPGYHAIELEHRLKVPWYQRPVLDFFADILWPGTIRDDQYLDLRLKPVPERTKEEDKALASEVAARAERLRDGPPPERKKK